MSDISTQIKKIAKDLGFDLVGFSQINADKDAYKFFKYWLEQKAEADMTYMSESVRVKKRKSTKYLMENAQTVISLGINYYHKQPIPKKEEGLIARYAYGRDYHKTIKSKLKEFENLLRTKFNVNTISYVDTGPILERSFAAQAGLGFIGKNSCLITKKFGSWVLLSEVITDLKLSSKINKFNTKLSCGNCTRCIDACPTKAITTGKNGKYFIDANKCLSYWTIEYKGPKSKIPKEIKSAIKKTKRLYGCDICQEVCPHNCRAKISTHIEFKKDKIAGNIQNLNEILKLKSEQEFLKIFAGSALMRAKLKGLKRTAQIIKNYIY